MTNPQLFARRVFFFAALYGFITIVPSYFMEDRLGREFPPPTNHPEQFYGFLGLALAWQCAFLVIARDVLRYRLLMLPAILEKLAFVVPAFILYAQGRVALPVAGFAVVDLAFALVFWLAFRATRDAGG